MGDARIPTTCTSERTTTRHRLAPLALIALSTAAAAAPAVSGRTAPTDPCKLAGRADVHAAFGGSVGAGKAETAVFSQCVFDVKRSKVGASGQAIVALYPEQTKATFKLGFKLIPDVVAVRGVGDAAFYNPHTTAIEFIKGTKVAGTQGVFMKGTTVIRTRKLKADVIALAKIVAKHL